MPVVTDVYAELRPLLFGIAYRMLGSVAEAEDVVQEAFLRHHAAVAAGTEVDSPKAFLSTVTTRLAIDQLRSARRQRETYVGEWLPEPIVTEPGPAEQAEQADTLSMAFLLLLERLSPVERAVFLLHDVFGYEFTEVADLVGKAPDNCRQIAARARKAVQAGRPRFAASRERRDELAASLLEAFVEGDVDRLFAALSDDVVVVGDSGGGGSPSWPHPITGRDRVARLLAGLSRQGAESGVELRAATVNGEPGAVAFAADGSVVSVFAFEFADGALRAFRSVANPAKLGHLGRVRDFREVWRDRRRGAQ